MGTSLILLKPQTSRQFDSRFRAQQRSSVWLLITINMPQTFYHRGDSLLGHSLSFLTAWRVVGMVSILINNHQGPESTSANGTKFGGTDEEVKRAIAVLKVQEVFGHHDVALSVRLCG
jgi:hypothetical protein